MSDIVMRVAVLLLALLGVAACGDDEPAPPKEPGTSSDLVGVYSQGTPSAGIKLTLREDGTFRFHTFDGRETSRGAWRLVADALTLTSESFPGEVYRYRIDDIGLHVFDDEFIAQAHSIQPQPFKREAVQVPAWAKVAPEQIAEAKKHGVPVAFENSIGMRFVLIPAGEAALWGAANDDDIIRVARPFYLQTTEVTAGQFRRCFPTLERIGPDSGTEFGASREGAVTFASWLTGRDGPPTYRLPSRDEWFYVLCADTSRWSCGDPIVEEISVFCRDHQEWPSCFRLVSPLPEPKSGR